MSLRGTLNNIGSGSSQAASSDGKLLKLVSKNDDTKSAPFPTNDPLRFNLHSSQQQQQHAASSESSSELKLLRRLTLTNSKEEEQWGDDDDFTSTATNEAPLLVKGTAGGSDDVKLLENNETNENDIEKIDRGTDDKVVVEESTQVEEEEFQNNTTVVADEEVMAASLMNVTNNGGSDDDDEVTIDIAASTTNNGNNNNSTADQLVENEGMKASSDSELTAPPSSTTSMLDLSSFTQATTLCQDDPTFIHPVYNQTCVDLVGEDESKCEVDYSEVRVVDNSDGVEEGEKMLKVKDVCKRSCGLCDDDDDDDIDTVIEQEELKLDEEEMEQLLKDSSKQGTTNETMVVDEEGVQEEEEEDESADENVDKKNASGIDTVEEEELAVKMADEDDAFIPEEEEEVVEVAAKEQVEKEIEGGKEEKDLDTSQEEEVTGTDDEEEEEDNEEEAVSTTDENDDQQLEVETESEVEIALDEGTDDEGMAEKLEEEMAEALEERIEMDGELVESGGNAAVEDNEENVIDESQQKEEGEEIDESILCQDDPGFEYKGYEGFDCAYIKEKKPAKCDKKHEGVKVGLSSCPVSCDMVDECMALQKRKNDVVVSPTDETTTEKSAEAIADEQVSEDHSDDSATEQKDDMQLEKEMESELETALEQGTVDEETAEILEEEMLEAIEEGVGGVFEKELEEELGLDGQEVSDDLSKEKTATEVDDGNNLATIDSSFTVDASSVVANATISEDDSSVCQDDPDFKFKGYEGFNCEYIKENKPGKCNKMFDGEKVGVVSCPVSCDMVDECMALQESKVGAALENATDNNVMGNNTTSEEDTVLTNTTAEETVDVGTENADALEGTEDDAASDDTKAQLAEGSEDTQVGAAGNTTEVVTSKEEAVETEQTDTEKEEDGSEELLDEQNTASSEEESNETDETTVLCQDDPDFKFKGYEGFNCEYIKENKPEKCNKLHDGEKVGVVSCPVSCDMVDECVELQESKVDAALENALENNETLSNTTSEEDAVVTNTTAEEIADVGTENADALEGTEDDAASDDTKAQLLVGGSEDTQVGAVLNTTEVVTSETETETSEELLKEQNTTSVDYSQATTIPSETQQEVDDETGEDQSLNDQELEQEIEAKLEKALEEGELDEEDAEELEYQMEEAIFEGVGEIFEAELDKELRCKDDPDFAIVDEDGQLRNCSWVRPNQRCDSVHEYSGKVIGTFFCPETCGMEDECENVTAADSTLQAPEDKTPGTEEDDSFEATPKGTKSMADEIEIESEFENGNVYGSENVDPFSGGDTEAGSFTNQNEYNQEPNSNVGYSQPTNGVEDWQGYGGENQQEGGSFDNNPPPIDYDENWLEDDSGFPFGFLILLFLGVGFFIFRKSQSSRLQENSRGGYQRVGGRIDIQDHNKRY
ncbi:hypothetical protein QTG54_011476 [Skeletonema marinoi]|uniref:Uncharacterized protein n=1 Tax=Skeletonema marinoi TaxID=267567 RepID=A0AAD8Y1Y9_9STRA|nr:hypothetical protein QTG54_011476 [Skeletonema marinoi]